MGVVCCAAHGKPGSSAGTGEGVAREEREKREDHRAERVLQLIAVMYQCVVSTL